MLLDYNAGLVKGAFPFLVSQLTLQPLDKFHKFLNDEEKLQEAARRRLDIKDKFDGDSGSLFYCINLKNLQCAALLAS